MLLWQTLLPSNAPLATDLNFEILGRRFEFNAGSIRSAIDNAATEAAMRENGTGAIMPDPLI